MLEIGFCNTLSNLSMAGGSMILIVFKFDVLNVSKMVMLHCSS